MRPKSTQPTPRQKQIFEWIEDFCDKNAMPPTVREIGDAFKIKSSTVFFSLKELERKGCIRRNGTARGLILNKHKRTAMPFLGKIAAGKPILAVEDPTAEEFDIPPYLKRHKGFVLRIEGDSMIDAGILDGDYVFVREQDTADDGDIVVALINDEATLKYFHREGPRVRLQPANKKMSPIYINDSEDFRIQGKVVGVQRLL